jgi:hypothetical protein
MKQCPQCHQTYTDDQLNFCLEDGELLTAVAPGRPSSLYADDPPPTVLLNESRVTNPANWPTSPQPSPVARWQGVQQDMQGRGLSSPAGFVASKDQTIPTISLILGIASVVLICCYGGIWLGLPAAILGFLGMRNADSNGSRYGGRGMAIGGMVLGGISLLASLAVAFIAILSS